MADRPIILSGPMIRALLDGRKTQTRRLLNPQPAKWEARVIDITTPFYCEEEKGWGQVETIWNRCSAMWEPEEEVWRPLKLPFAAGDRAYVRENFQLLSFGDYLPTKARPADVRFAATDPCADLPVDTRGYPWRPCIHMPRWASRLTLFVDEVRVQRLQDISEQDAIAEGIAEHPCEGPCRGPNATYWTAERSSKDYLSRPTPIAAYAALWDSLHTEPGTRWADSPWIYALTFSVKHGNIDQLETANG